MLQKRVSKKYRKKMSSKEKKKKKEIVHKTKENSFGTRLYTLPLDLKIKIFQMSVQGNMNDWLEDHQDRFQGTLTLLDYETNTGFIDLKCDYKDGFWVKYEWIRESYLLHEDDRYFSHSTLCDKTDISETYLPLSLNNYEYRHREWKDKPDNYWYSETCRCEECDKVKDAQKEYQCFLERQKEKSESCTRILRDCVLSSPPHRYMVERAIEIVDNHYLNDPE